jgi:hypothetical protein
LKDGERSAAAAFVASAAATAIPAKIAFIESPKLKRLNATTKA